MANDGCIFCKIAAGDIQATVVHADDRTVAFRDLNPQAPVHVLIVPRVHIASLEDLDDPELSHALLQAARQIARKEGLNGGWRLVTNIGPDAGQSVAHLHWHLLGGRSMSWPPG